MGYSTTLGEWVFEKGKLPNNVRAKREQRPDIQISFYSKQVQNRISDQEDSALFVDDIGKMIEGNGMK